MQEQFSVTPSMEISGYWIMSLSVTKWCLLLSAVLFNGGLESFRTISSIHSIHGDIRVLDHIIVGDEVVSFAERGLI